MKQELEKVEKELELRGYETINGEGWSESLPGATYYRYMRYAGKTHLVTVTLIGDRLVIEILAQTSSFIVN